MITLHCGDCLDVLREMPSGTVQCAVTSPPYYNLRDYGVSGQIGLEKSPDEYVVRLVEVFREVRRVLKDDGTFWLNIGDSYASGGGKTQPHRNSSGGVANSDGRRTQGYALAGGGFERHSSIGGGVKPKDLLMIPARVALALQADGWFLRSQIVWHKPNPMPESVTDRPTSAYELVYLLARSPRYFYDADAVREPLADDRAYPDWADRKAKGAGSGTREIGRWDAAPHGGSGVGANPAGRNLRNVWSITPKPYKGAHFATFPPALAERCIKAGSRPGDTVLDPFAGSGTTGMVAERLGRNAVLIELNPAYAAMARERLGLFAPRIAAE